jgi:hypothetical protein
MKTIIFSGLLAGVALLILSYLVCIRPVAGIGRRACI